MTTIEKVARALCENAGYSPDRIYINRHGKQESWEWWREYIGPARAALSALIQNTTEDRVTLLDDGWDEAEIDTVTAFVSKILEGEG